MNCNLGNVAVAGEFKVVLKNAAGIVTRETPWNANLLTNRFFSHHASNYFGFVGTGSTPPANSDTKLASLLGSAGTAAGSTSGSATVSGDSETGYTLTTASIMFRWNLGQVVGNISEWGWAETSNVSTYQLSVRSLVKDANGNPTTIPVTASDQLEIWWRLRKKAPGAAQMRAAEATSTVMLNGVSTQVKFTQLNPGVFDSVHTFDTSPNRPALMHYCHVKTCTVATAIANELRDAAAGTTLTNGSTLTAEQAALSQSFTHSSPSAGVAKYTTTVTFGLNASGANLPMQFILLDDYGAQAVIPAKAIARITFNPQFTKGTDKILTIRYSYTVSRG